MKIKNLFQKLRLAALFLLLIVIFTYPLILHLTDAIPGNQSYTDGPFFLWNIWWVKESLLALKNPLYTQIIFFPQNVNLAFHTLTISLGLLYLPFALIFKNLIILGNLVVIGSFILNGLFAYLLVKQLTKSRLAGFIIACYLAFHPYIFSHLYAGHFNLIQIWTIPATLWLILKPSKLWRRKAILLGLLLSFQSYIDFHYTLFTGIALIIWLALSPILKQKYLAGFKVLLLAAAIWTVLLLPMFSAIKLTPTDMESTDNRTIQTLSWRPFWSNNPFHPIWGNQSWNYLQSLPGQVRENSLTVGWVILSLAAISLFLIPKKTSSKNNLTGWLWLFILTGLVFALITPGEKISVWGNEITLPYTTLKNLPVFNQGLALPRFGIMVIISLAVLAGITLSILLNKLKGWKKYTIFSLILILMISEIWSFPLALDKIVRHPKKLIASLDMESDWSFIYLPNSPRSSFFIAFFNRPLVGGYIGRRVNNLYQSFYQKYAGVRVLTNPSADIFEGEYKREKVTQSFKKLGIRYIMVDKDILPDKEASNIRPYLKFLNFPTVYTDEQLDIYEVVL